jgi:RNA polymerase sigma-70 factor (ECF subfamily)
MFHLHRARVYNLARRMLVNEADAEDVMQEVFLQVTRKVDSFRGNSDITTWLHRLTVNAARMHLRREARRDERPLGLPIDTVANFALPGNCSRLWRGNPEKAALDRESRHLIDRAVRTLPSIYHDVFVLADIDGLSNADIGRLLGLRLPAVKSRLRRARMIVRSNLAQYFEGTTASSVAKDCEGSKCRVLRDR